MGDDVTSVSRSRDLIECNRIDFVAANFYRPSGFMFYEICFSLQANRGIVLDPYSHVRRNDGTNSRVDSSSATDRSDFQTRFSLEVTGDG